METAPPDFPERKWKTSGKNQPLAARSHKECLVEQQFRSPSVAWTRSVVDSTAQAHVEMFDSFR